MIASALSVSSSPGSCVAPTDRDAREVMDPSAFDIEGAITDHNDRGFVFGVRVWSVYSANVFEHVLNDFVLVMSSTIDRSSADEREPLFELEMIQNSFGQICGFR
jgi:hypothetical protein